MSPLLASGAHHRLGSRRRCATAIGTALIVLSLAACSSPVRIQSMWRGETYVGPAFQHYLVVGVSSNANRRQRFEGMLADAVRTRGTAADPSLRYLRAAQQLDRDTVGAAVREAGADAVLVTRLVSREVVAGEVPGRTGVKTQRRSESPVDFFRYDYREYAEPPVLIAKNDVILATDLYETQAGKLIYTVEITSTGLESEYDIFDQVTRAIAKRLQKDGLAK